MLVSILVAIAPFLGKFSLFLIDKCIKSDVDKAAARKAVLQSMHDYNITVVESANLHIEYQDLIKQYLANQNGDSRND